LTPRRSAFEALICFISTIEDVSYHYTALSTAGDALKRLAAVVNIEVFRGSLSAAPRLENLGKGVHRLFACHPRSPQNKIIVAPSSC
jgi:hypothetical protein